MKDCCFQVTVPLLLVNSWDDPLVHPSLLDIPRTLAGFYHLLLKFHTLPPLAAPSTAGLRTQTSHDSG